MQDFARRDPATPTAVSLTVAAAALLCCWLAFLAEKSTGFNLWDEGFLWYGVQRVLAGEMPVRDFMAYNPGRYYWAAGLLRLFDAEGPVALRATTACFGALGIAMGTVLVLRNGRWPSLAARAALAVLAAALYLLWMIPWWKTYDSAISLMLVVGLAAVLAKPVSGRFFVHGVLVGLAAVIGRNHGAYAVVSCLLAVPPLLLGTRLRWSRCIVAWCGGVVFGFAPMLAMFAMDPRFLSAFMQDLHQLLITQKGATVPIPVPWPWAAPANWRILVVGLFFVALPAFAAIGAWIVSLRAYREQALSYPAFTAAVATAIPYLNVAFSRADVPHLAQAMFPLLIGVLVWPWKTRIGAWANATAIAILTCGSLIVALAQHPAYQMRMQPSLWRSIEIEGDKLQVPASAAASVRTIRALADCHVGRGGSILAAPVWPGAYALLRTKSPVWDIYPLAPRDEAFQQQEIHRLRAARPDLVLIKDVAVSGRAELRYSANYPIIWRYIEAEFARIDAGEEPDLIAFVPRTGTQKSCLSDQRGPDVTAP